MEAHHKERKQVHNNLPKHIYIYIFSTNQKTHPYTKHTRRLTHSAQNNTQYKPYINITHLHGFRAGQEKYRKENTIYLAK